MNVESPGPASEGQGSQVSPEDTLEVSLADLVRVLGRHRLVLLTFPVAALVLVLGWNIVGSDTFTARASFTPSDPAQGSSQVSSLARRFGVQGVANGSNRSPAFYAELLRSDDLLRSVARSPYAPTGDAGSSRDSLPLYKFLSISGESPNELASNGARWIRDQALDVTVRPEAGLVELSVTTESAYLSHQIAERLLEAVHDFNLETRQSQAAAERRFLAERLEQVRTELETFEDSLQTFLERNRSFRGSPQLRFQHDRLQRRVGLHQQLVSSLAQSYEEARMEEVRSTPVITVFNRPERPQSPDTHNLLLLGVMALIVGALAALFWIVASEAVASYRRSNPEEYRELAEALERDWLRPLRRGARFLRGGGEGPDGR